MVQMKILNLFTELSAGCAHNKGITIAPKMHFKAQSATLSGSLYEGNNSKDATPHFALFPLHSSWQTESVSI
jgi:hypothetical protein